MNLDGIPAPQEGFQIQTLDGEAVLLHPARNIIIHMNQTSVLVWQLCDGTRTMDEITEILSALYPESADQISADVPDAIQALIKQGAVQQK